MARIRTGRVEGTGSATYVIIGAGAAGCALAERLSRNESARIILIEAGPSDDHPYIRMPKGLGQIAGNSKYVWAFPARSQDGCPQEIWPRGRTLGGSTSTNGFIYNRGRPEDYDALEQSGCRGWNWNSIEPYFVQLEGHELGRGPGRGAAGPLHITMPRFRNLYRDLIETGRELGLATPQDMNAPEPFTTGAIGLLPRTIYGGRRWSAARAFLDKAAKRPNVEILTETRADHLLIADDKSVTGVACSRMDGSTFEVHARAEVIVAAGTIGSPALLQRSGIGHAAALAGAGVKPLVDLPGVGSNLAEHRNAYFQFRMRMAADSQNRDHRGGRLVANALRYFTTHSGPLAEGTCEVGAFVRSGEESERIDTQILLMPVSMGAVAPGSSEIRVEKKPGITIIAYQLRPRSRGSIFIRSPNPAEPPEIVANYLDDAEDQNIAVAAARYVRKMMSTDPIGRMVEREIGPLADASTDEEIIDAWLRFGGPGCHAVGTCRMGGDILSVVDPELRVRQLRRLRIVDNSVFPFIPAGNTAAAVMACALRAADIISGASHNP